MASFGGVANVGDEKLKNSVMSFAAASRAVSVGSEKRASMNLRMDVWSLMVCETKCGLAHGEMTMTGTRTP